MVWPIKDDVPPFIVLNTRLGVEDDEVITGDSCSELVMMMMKVSELGI